MYVSGMTIFFSNQLKDEYLPLSIQCTFYTKLYLTFGAFKQMKYSTLDFTCIHESKFFSNKDHYGKDLGPRENFDHCILLDTSKLFFSNFSRVYKYIYIYTLYIYISAGRIRIWK